MSQVLKMPGLLKRQLPGAALPHDVPRDIRDAVVRDLFSIVADAPPREDRGLRSTADRLLRQHLTRVAAGELDPASSVPAEVSNVSCLGTLDDMRSDVAQHGSVHAWGHFVRPPRAHAAALATFTPTDGIPRVYMATAWRA
jgi:hypothetical protein